MAGLFVGVHPAIDLDYQPLRDAKEVDDVRTERMLATEA